MVLAPDPELNFPSVTSLVLKINEASANFEFLWKLEVPCDFKRSFIFQIY